MGFWDVVETVAPFVIPAATIGGAIVSSNAAERAAEAQAAGARQAADVNERIFRQSREDFAPYRDVGSNALYHLASLGGVDYEGAPGSPEDRYATAMSRFYLSPDYRFRLNEGITALDRSAAARGKLMSGGQLKAITEFGQGLAASEYGNYYNRLAGLSGIGQSATGNTAAAGAAAAPAIGRAVMEQGTARASGYTGKANAVTDALNNMLYWYGYGRRTA